MQQQNNKKTIKIGNILHEINLKQTPLWNLNTEKIAFITIDEMDHDIISDMDFSPILFQKLVIYPDLVQMH